MISNKKYTEVQSLRDVSGNNFSKGVIKFDFGNNGAQWRFNPSKSYFKVRVKITKGDDTRIDRNFNLAPNMFMMDTMFQSIHQKINGVDVSSLKDYVGECSALKKRMYSKAWLDSVGKLELSQSNFYDRLNVMAVDGFDRNKINITNNNPPTVANAALGTVPSWLSTGNTVQFVSANTAIIFRRGGVNNQKIPDLSKIYNIGDKFAYNDSVGETIGVITGFRTLPIEAPNNAVDPNDLNAINNVLTMSVVNNDGAAAVFGVLFRELPPTIRVEPSLRANNLEIIWKPSLGFWDLDKWCCSGNYSFQLIPHPGISYAKYCVESLLNLEPISVGPVGSVNNYKVEIISMLMYICEGISNKQPVNHSLIYSEVRCQSQSLTTNSIHQKTFIVNPNSYGLTLAFSDQNTGSDTRFSRTKFKIENNEERNLSRFYLRYKQRELPSPYPDIDLERSLPAVANIGISYITQRYAESLLYAGRFYSNGGFESLNEWLERGPYYHFQYDSNLTDDRVYVSTRFHVPFTSQPQIMLFDHFYRSLNLQVSNGSISNVSVSETN